MSVPEKVVVKEKLCAQVRGRGLTEEQLFGAGNVERGAKLRKAGQRYALFQWASEKAEAGNAGPLAPDGRLLKSWGLEVVAQSGGEAGRQRSMGGGVFHSG